MVYLGSMKKTINGIPIKEYRRKSMEKDRRRRGIPSRSEVREQNFKSFISTSQQIHKNKYDYSLVDYKSSQTKVTIICPIHGNFEQQPHCHKIGQGCPACGKESRCGSTHERNKTFISKSTKVHSKKYQYDSTDYKNLLTKVKIVCPEHGPFVQTPKAHLRGQGCPDCANLVRSNLQKSKGELIIESYLNNRNIEYVPQKTFEGCKFKQLLRFDFYLPKLKMLIEYDGDQHYKFSKKFHGNLETFKLSQAKDKIKDKFSNKNGLKLVRIRFKKRSQENYITNILDSLIPVCQQTPKP
jgi:very-short-patch-repair endonuclease